MAKSGGDRASRHNTHGAIATMCRIDKEVLRIRPAHSPDEKQLKSETKPTIVLSCLLRSVYGREMTCGENYDKPVTLSDRQDMRCSYEQSGYRIRVCAWVSVRTG